MNYSLERYLYITYSIHMNEYIHSDSQLLTERSIVISIINEVKRDLIIHLSVSIVAHIILKCATFWNVN
jgi:hypothetical protein